MQKSHAGMEVSMKSRREKIFAIIMPLAIVCALSYGVYSVVNSTKNTKENNIVNLNDTEDGSVALKTEDVTDTVMPDSDINDVTNAELANASATKDNSSEKTEGKSENENQDIKQNISYNNDSLENDVAQEEPSTQAIAGVVAEGQAVSGVNSDIDIASAYTFSEADSLLWPVSGDIVLKYSMDSTIFFPTLGVYKCNPAISIKADEGTNVGVAASGVVKSVTVNEETGTTVDVAIGNGYETTYGLLDNVVVRSGDKVTKGQLLGTVSAPTAYYTKEGANLYFKVTKDGVSVDPMELLAE
jgi:murein DD-endopeptidase MepM/ murein hydrolase activator NlpD